MATFFVTAPSGKKYKIGAPDDTSEEDLMLKAREMELNERTPEPWYQDFAEGVGLSGLETVYGSKELFADLSDEEKARLEDWRQDAGQSGWGTGGQVVGEILQTVAPGGGLAKALKAVSKTAKYAPKIARGIGDIAAYTGLSALQSPDIGETRRENAETAANSAATGEIIGRGLSKAVRGLSKTPAAKRLTEDGIYLSPGQAAESTAVQRLESIMEVTPFLARGTKAARKRGVDESVEKAFSKAAPPGYSIGKTGTEGVQELKKAFNSAYEDAWKSADSISDNGIDSIETYIINGMDEVTNEAQSLLSRVASNIRKLGQKDSGTAIRQLDNDLRKRISSSKNDPILQEMLQNIRNMIREDMPSNVAEKLKAVDSKYGSYLVVRRAAKNSAENLGVPEPKQLIQAVKAIGKDQAGLGNAPLQGYATDVMQTAGRDIGGQPLEWMRRAADLSPTPLPMQAIGKVLMGETGVQKAGNVLRKSLPETIARPGLYFGVTEDETKDYLRR